MLSGLPHGWAERNTSSIAGIRFYDSTQDAALKMQRNTGANLECERLVPDPVDAPPMRSPQAVHSALLPRVTGKDLVEIGTRNGDGISCFAQVARRATAIELSPAYCKKLRERSGRLHNSTGRHFAVDCRSYRNADLDADVITWWAEEPILKELGRLAGARRACAIGPREKGRGSTPRLRSAVATRPFRLARLWGSTCNVVCQRECTRKGQVQGFRQQKAPVKTLAVQAGGGNISRGCLRDRDPASQPAAALRANDQTRAQTLRYFA